MSLFPFLILVTALAGFLFGSTQLADEVAKHPSANVADRGGVSIAGEIRRVLLGARSDLPHHRCGAGDLLRLERHREFAHRVERAYGVSEAGVGGFLRLESIGYVLIAAVGLLVMSFLVVLHR